MEENITEVNGQKSPRDQGDEKMEITVTTQLQGLNVTPDNVDLQSNTQTHPEEGAAHTDSSAAAMLPLDAVCKKEECESEESEDSDSDSSSSSSSTSSSSSSSSSPSAPIFEDEDDDEGFSQPPPIKTRDEILLEELPAAEDVCVTLPGEAELQPVGTVSSIIQQLVVIQSLKDTPPLTDESIIFTSDRQVVGKVFEVFGPVSSPLYILRFNSAEQITSKGLTEGLTVYYAPAIREFTGYILTQQLKLSRGSDASWKNDQEPPEEALDYSDDEKEKEAKKKIKNCRKKRDKNNTDNPAHTSQNTLQPQQQQSCDVRGFPPRHARPPFRHQNMMNKQPMFQHTNVPPPPMYLPPLCPYPPPQNFPPPNFPLYPPPPPSFFNPSFSSPLWPPNSIPLSDFPPPPPPPPPAPPQ